MQVVITIPAYNEEKTIGNVINSIKKVMQKENCKFKIQVIDDGSTDKTAEKAKKAGALVYSHPHNYGLAETFRTEMQKALEFNPDIIIHTDADGQYLAEDLPKLIECVKEGYDLVLGSRFMGRIESMAVIKRWGNKAFSRVISQITKTKITDCQTGFRAFTPEVAKMGTSSTHTYTQEQVIRAIQNKFKIKEVPVYFAKRHGKSRLISNPFEYAFKAWVNILRIYRDYEPLKFFGYTGATFILAGFSIGVWLLYRFLTLGYVQRIPSTILSMLLIVVGLQIVLFGFLADMKSSH